MRTRGRSFCHKATPCVHGVTIIVPRRALLNRWGWLGLLLPLVGKSWSLVGAEQKSGSEGDLLAPSIRVKLYDFAAIGIFLGLASSGLGNVTVRTPSSNSASMASVSMPVGRAKERSNLP